MKDYSVMSDFEINLAVAHIDLGKGNYDWSAEKKEVYRAGMDGGEFLPNAYFDPCNNPADAWPIIAENKISLNWSEIEKIWCAHVTGVMTEGCWCWDSDPAHHHDDSNPLRAAMIVYLMMRGAE